MGHPNLLTIHARPDIWAYESELFLPRRTQVAKEGLRSQVRIDPRTCRAKEAHKLWSKLLMQSLTAFNDDPI